MALIVQVDELGKGAIEGTCRLRGSPKLANVHFCDRLGPETRYPWNFQTLLLK